MNIMGLDMSLRGTAMVVVSSDWKLGDWDNLLGWQRINPGEMRGIKRIDMIVEGVLIFANDYGIDRVFVEQYAFGFRTSSVTMLAELGGAIKYSLYEKYALDSVAVTPGQARKVIFGNLGRLKRKELKATIVEKFRLMHSPFGENDDLCDAFVIANFGLSECGFPALVSQ